MDVRTDHFNVVNAVFTVCIALVAVGFVFWLHRGLRRWVEGMLDGMIAQIKAELPPLLVGELMTRQDVEQYEERLSQVEAQARNLEHRIAGHEPGGTGG